MSDKFIYDVKTSRLYAPDGTFLKEMYCPKAKHWNQLLVVDSEDRWRGCQECGEKVFNLDECDADELIQSMKQNWRKPCVYATSESQRVLFLEDPELEDPNGIQPWKGQMDGVVVIKTARTVEDINRAVGLGYWPDVRVVDYDQENLWGRFQIEQCATTGHIHLSTDYRSKISRHSAPETQRSRLGPDYLDWQEVIPFTEHYPYFQPYPIAAYLIPLDLPDETQVLVLDPIEERLGIVWNQGDNFRASEVPGKILGRKVLLDWSRFEVTNVVG